MRTNDAQMLVLSALADGPLHGYAVNEVIERVTGARLGRGSLSGALARLTAKGLVAYLPGEGRRRPLHLTPAGRTLLDAEVTALNRVAGRLFETVAPRPAVYQDRLAALDPVRAYKRDALDALALAPGHTVADLGCGPGTDLPALARAVCPGGTVLGVDADPAMLAAARTRTAGLAARTALLHADVHALPLPSGSVDRVHTDRVVQHLADPGALLAEVRRVLRPGGRLVTAEPDWDSLAVDHPDPALSRAYTRHVTDRVIRNPLVGRQLPRLAEQSGFTVTAVTPATTVFRDVRAADTVLGLHRVTERAVAAEYLTPSQADVWLDHLATGPFFAALTLYVMTAEVR